MADGMLRVRAVTGVLVQNLEALEAGARRYVGRSVKPPVPPQGPAKKVEYLPAGDPVVVDDLYPIGSEIAEVPDRAEYRKALRDGSLVAADKETAAIVGLEFKSAAKAVKES